MTAAISPNLTLYKTCPSLQTSYSQAPKWTAASAILAAIGYVSGDWKAWSGAAVAALAPFVNWYRSVSYTMGKDLRGANPLQQLQNLFTDLVCCGLQGENRALATAKLQTLKAYPASAFGDVNVVKELSELTEIISRKDDKITLMTFRFDLERLYFDVCLGNKNFPLSCKIVYNAILHLLTPLANNSIYQKYIQKLAAIHAATNPTPKNLSQRIALEARTILLGLQKGALSKDEALRKFQALKKYLEAGSDCLLLDEFRADMINILALLVPAPKAPATHIYDNREVPTPATAQVLRGRDLYHKQPEPAHAGFVRAGLPNFGKPRLYNICWMNSACQLVFQSPLVRLVHQKVNEGTSTPILKLLAALHNAQQQGKPEAALQVIQEQMIDLYETKNKTFAVGNQHDPYTFVEWVIIDLGLSLSMTQITAQVPGTAPKITQNTANFIVVAHQKGKNTIQCILSTPQIALVDSRDLQGNSVKLPITRHMNTVPRQIVFRFDQLQHRQRSQTAHEADFSSLFTNDVRKKHKNLRYRLCVGDRHSNPGASKGHYTAQEREGFHHFDDRRVDQVSAADASSNFSDSPLQLWELCEA